MDLSFLFLHGFLGAAGDGEALRRAFRAPPLQWQAWDLPTFTPSIDDMDSWAAQVEPQVRSLRLRRFVGYSMGGRLGLHLLKRNPDAFDEWFFVSTNPGLSDPEERSVRRAADEAWARRFEDPADEAVLGDWNAQPVFQGGRVEPDRSSRMAQREIWARCLRRWSLAEQQDFRPLLQREARRIHWVVGAKDVKFMSLAETLEKEQGLRVHRVRGAGHRLVQEAPSELARLLERS